MMPLLSGGWDVVKLINSLVQLSKKMLSAPQKQNSQRSDHLEPVHIQPFRTPRVLPATQLCKNRISSVKTLRKLVACNRCCLLSCQHDSLWACCASLFVQTQKLGQRTAPNFCSDSTEVEVCIMLLSIKRCWITISSLSTLWENEFAACSRAGPFNYGITQVLSIKGKQHLTNEMQNLQTLKLPLFSMACSLE